MPKRNIYKASREAYQRMTFRGSYHSWAARNGLDRPGADPITGRKPWAAYGWLAQDEGRAVNAALVRFWFGQARTLRVVAGIGRLPA